MIYLDSNFLAAFNIENHPLKEQCLNLLEKFIIHDFSLGVSSLTLDELWYIYGNTIKRGESWKAKGNLIEDITTQLLDMPHLNILGAKDEISYILSALENIKTYSLKPRDAFHLSMMQQWDITEIATFDSDFRRIESIMVYP